MGKLAYGSASVPQMAAPAEQPAAASRTGLPVLKASSASLTGSPSAIGRAA